MERPARPVQVLHLVGDANVAIAHGTLQATDTGRFYGAPATKKHDQASFVDYVSVDNAASPRECSKPTSSDK